MKHRPRSGAQKEDDPRVKNAHAADASGTCVRVVCDFIEVAVLHSGARSARDAK